MSNSFFQGLMPDVHREILFTWGEEMIYHPEGAGAIPFTGVYNEPVEESYINGMQIFAADMSMETEKGQIPSYHEDDLVTIDGKQYQVHPPTSDDGMWLKLDLSDYDD